MAFWMKSKFFNGPCEVLCDLHVHLLGLRLPSVISFHVLCALASESSYVLFSCLEKLLSSAFLQLLLQGSSFIVSFLGTHFLPLAWVSSLRSVTPAEACPSPITVNCHDLVIVFFLGTEMASFIFCCILST